MPGLSLDIAVPPFSAAMATRKEDNTTDRIVKSREEEFGSRGKKSKQNAEIYQSDFQESN